MNVFYSCGCSGNCSDDPCDCQSQPCLECAAVVTTTTVPCIGEKCDEIYDCKCIIYNGPDLACYGVYTGDNLCRILEIAASNLVAGCATTTTTTIAPCDCYNYTLTPNPHYDVTVVRYIECVTNLVKQVEITKPTIVCSVSTPEFMSSTHVGTIVKGGCCTYTTTIPPRQRCTNAAYYAINMDWSNVTYPISYQLEQLELNGIEYAHGEILTLLSAADLIIGIGLDGATPFIMNINDWLTSVANNTMVPANASGFEFHDDMQTFDTPHPNSTWSIKITKTESNGYKIDYYYDSLSGFGYDMGQSGTIQWVDPLTSCSSI